MRARYSVTDRSYVAATLGLAGIGLSFRAEPRSGGGEESVLSGQRGRALGRDTKDSSLRSE